MTTTIFKLCFGLALISATLANFCDLKKEGCCGVTNVYQGITHVYQNCDNQVLQGKRKTYSRFQYEAEELNEEEVDRFLLSLEENQFKPRKLTLSGFSWTNCAKGSDVEIKSLSVSPDPIPFPGIVTVQLDATVKSEITGPSSLSLVIMKKAIFGIYVKIPCVNNVGSCTYKNICGLLEGIKCPQQIIDLGFKCHCPFAAKEYNVPAGTKVTLPTISIPSFLFSGDYKVKATLSKGSTVLACYDIKTSLQKE